VSCHHPELGGGDALPVSIGTGAVDPSLLGPGRLYVSGPPDVPRNAPTTFNIGMWDQVLFWDGRVESLTKAPGSGGAGAAGIRTPDTIYLVADPRAGEDLVAAQSRFPLTSEAEMRGRSFAYHQPRRVTRALLCARLGDFGMGQGDLEHTTWAAEFEKVFGSQEHVESSISDSNIAAALSAYERSQVFVDTPWRAYVQGDTTAISDSARRGAMLFFRSTADGGANCAACHRGDFFTDEQFHVLSVPQIGPGTDDAPYPDRLDDADTDFGRYHATFLEEDRFAFRTPMLLNVEVTGPYGHDGAYSTLEAIIRHHLNPSKAAKEYDVSQLKSEIQTANMQANTAATLAKLAEDQRQGRTPLQNIQLTDRQVADLVSFLLTLTDPCVKDVACLSPWLPGANDPDPDGLRVVARFAPREAPP
jgi:cytochrome c peroxidase